MDPRHLTFVCMCALQKQHAHAAASYDATKAVRPLVASTIVLADHLELMTHCSTAQRVTPLVAVDPVAGEWTPQCEG